MQQWRKSAPPGTYRRVAQSKNKQPLARGELGFYTDGFAKLMSRRARHLIGAHAALLLLRKLMLLRGPGRR